MQHPAAEIEVLIDDEHAGTEVAGANGRRDPGTAATGDDHIDLVVPLDELGTRALGLRRRSLEHGSRAKTGGMTGAVGLAEDTSDASIACRQTGPVDLSPDIADKSRDGEEVFKQRTSILFKTMQVVRFYDARRNTLIYLTYSDKLVEGSPKNSITAVPLYRPPPASP